MESVFYCPDVIIKHMELNAQVESAVNELQGYVLADPLRLRSHGDLLELFSSELWKSSSLRKVLALKRLVTRFYREAIAVMNNCSYFLIGPSGEFDWILAGVWLAKHGNKDIYRVIDDALMPTRIPLKISKVFILDPLRKSKEGMTYTLAVNVDANISQSLVEVLNSHITVNDKRLGSTSYLNKKLRNKRKICVKISTSDDFMMAGYLLELLGSKNVYIDTTDVARLQCNLFEYANPNPSGVWLHKKY